MLYRIVQYRHMMSHFAIREGWSELSLTSHNLARHQQKKELVKVNRCSFSRTVPSLNKSAFAFRREEWQGVEVKYFWMCFQHENSFILIYKVTVLDCLEDSKCWDKLYQEISGKKCVCSIHAALTIFQSEHWCLVCYLLGGSYCFSYI